MSHLARLNDMLPRANDPIIIEHICKRMAETYKHKLAFEQKVAELKTEMAAFTASIAREDK